jgi:hypothetical protein
MNQRCVMTAFLAMLVALALPAPVVLADDVPAAAEPSGDAKVDPPGGDRLELPRHRTGTVGDAGQFPGKLVCLRSKEAFTPLSASECASGERVYALEVDGSDERHPIQAGSPEIEDQLRGLLGKEVVVQGKYQNATGMLTAASVRARSDGNDPS